MLALRLRRHPIVSRRVLAGQRCNPAAIGLDGHGIDLGSMLAAEGWALVDTRRTANIWANKASAAFSTVDCGGIVGCGGIAGNDKRSLRGELTAPMRCCDGQSARPREWGDCRGASASGQGRARKGQNKSRLGDRQDAQQAPYHLAYQIALQGAAVSLRIRCGGAAARRSARRSQGQRHRQLRSSQQAIAGSRCGRSVCSPH